MNDAIFALIPITALMIPIIAILSRLASRWMRLKEKQLESQSQLAAEKAAQYVAHTDRLEQRVRVLEQIVTDGGYDTAAKIEALREPRLSTGDQVQ